MSRQILIIASLVAATALSGCSGTQAVKDAAPDIAAFHRQLDAQAYDAIWKSADPAFRMTAEADATKLFSAIHTKLGNVMKSEQTGWNVQYGTSGKLVTVGMQTTFQHGTGTEQFIFKDDSSKRALYSYNINSADMMLK